MQMRAALALLFALGCTTGLGRGGKGAPADDPQALAASVARGRPIYLASCAPCHGDDGAGSGPLAAGYDPPPTDLIAPGVHVSVQGIEVTIQYPHYSDRVLRGRISGGNAAMPAWKDVLTPQETEDLIAYVRALAEAHDAAQDTARDDQ